MAAGRVNAIKNGVLPSLPTGPFDSEQGLSCGHRDGGWIRDARRFGTNLVEEINHESVVVMDFELSSEPLQKRKKLSPILWDKKRTKHNSFGPVFKDYGNVDPELFDSPFGISSSLTYQTCSSGDPEPGQLEEEDYSNGPNILTSRWASDDGHMQEDDLHEAREKKARNSPEGDVTSYGCRGAFVPNAPYNSGSVVHNDEFLEAGPVMNEKSFTESAVDSVDIALRGNSREPSSNMFLESRSVSEYENLGKINEGSYGIVFRARDKKSGDVVALKKLKMGKEREGFPLHYLREINNMLSFNHPSILSVKEIVVDDSDHGFDDVYMVMEYMEHDLKALIESRKQPFSQSEVKCLMMQLLEGVKYLHDNWILHRDLKTSNLLLNNEGDLKICDFGMSRQYGSPLKPYTSWVVTLWYRAPELLFGVKEYSTAVDMWSVGCIMAELLAGKPLFDGRTEVDQLNKIFKTLGTPNDKVWPGYSDLPRAKVNFVHQPYNMLPKKFPRTSFTGSPVLSELGLDLLSKLLTYAPEKRITAEDALNHPWFHEAPQPKSKEFVPTFSATSIRMR